MNDAAAPPLVDPQALMRSALQRIATGPELSKDLTRDETRRVMQAILARAVPDVQAGVFLIALRMKRETDEENLGVLEAIVEATDPITAEVDEVLDVADPYNGFNRNLPVAAFVPSVLAACGVATVCHGVETMGPKFGATFRKVLRAAGADVALDKAGAAARLADPEAGWAYVDQSEFCPSLHSLMDLRTAIVKRPVITTVEVLAGPIRGRRGTHAMTGYVHKPYARVYAMLARHAGFDSALIVRGVEGGVIPSLRQTGKVWTFHGEAAEHDADFDPAALGIDQPDRAVPLPDSIEGYRRKNDQSGTGEVDADAIAAAAAEAGLEALRDVPGPARDSLVYGAAIALWHLGRAASGADAAALARDAIRSGRARAAFEAGRAPA